MSLNSEQIKTILSSSTQTLPIILDTLYATEHHPEHEKTIISIINNQLKSEKTRFKAFELLQKSIDYFSIESLSENASNWASYCVPHPTDATKDIKLNTLSIILKNTVNIDTFHKKFQSEHLSSVLKTCTVFKNESEQIACMTCLNECMKKYPAWFGSHRSKIEAIIIESLDSNNINLVKIASASFLCFVQVGGAGEGGINYVNNFSNSLNKICATVHSLFDEFFEDFMDVEGGKAGDVFSFEQSAKPKSRDLVTTRIINCLYFLKSMIVRRFSFEKRVIIKNIVDVINRGLSWHVCTSEPRVSLDTINQGTLLKKIQLELLKLSQILVKIYKQNLLPFGFILKKSLVNILKNMSKCHCMDYDVLFISNVYKTINCWLLLNGNFNDSQLVAVLLKNITPVRKTTLLTQKNQSGGASSGLKLSKRRDFVAVTNCLSALDTLEVLVRTSTFLNNQKLIQELVDSIVGLLGDIQTKKMVAPYTNENCQVGLYQVLVSLFRGEDLRVFPSLHLVVGVFLRGLSGGCKVAQVSREGLDLLEKVCHPVCSGLNVGGTEMPQLNKEPFGDAFEVEEVEVVREEEDEVMEVGVEESRKESVIEEMGEDSRVVEEAIEVKVVEEAEEVEVAEEAVEVVAESPPVVVEDAEQDPSPGNEDAASEEMFSTFQDVVQ